MSASGREPVSQARRPRAVTINRNWLYLANTTDRTTPSQHHRRRRTVPILELPRPLSGQWWSEQALRQRQWQHRHRTTTPAYKVDAKGNIMNTAPRAAARADGRPFRDMPVNTYPTLKIDRQLSVSLDRRRLLRLHQSGGVLTAVSTRAAKENFRTSTRKRSWPRSTACRFTEWNYKQEGPAVNTLVQSLKTSQPLRAQWANIGLVSSIDPSRGARRRKRPIELDEDEQARIDQLEAELVLAAPGDEPCATNQKVRISSAPPG